MGRDFGSQASRTTEGRPRSHGVAAASIGSHSHGRFSGWYILVSGCARSVAAVGFGVSAGVHNLDLASVSVDQLQAQVGPLDNLTLAGATAGRGRQLDTTATSDPIDVTADAGIISVTLSPTPGG